MSFNVQLKGADVLEKKMRKMSDIDSLFDGVVRVETARSLSRLLRTTPIGASGDLRRHWTRVVKKGPSHYILSNDLRTKNRKYYIANIIDKGRKTILPKKGKKLYIPLTNKGISRDKSAVFGVDFVLAKKSKAVAPTHFIRDEKIKSRRELTKGVIKKIRSVHGGS